MENLALYFLWSGLTASAVSSLFYLIYVFQPKLVLIIGRTQLHERAVTTESGDTDGITFPRSEGQRRVERSSSLAAMSSFSAVITVVLGGIGLTLRWISLDHAPYSNLFEFSMAFGFAIALVYVGAERRLGSRVLGAFVMPISFALFASSLAFPSAGQPVLVPALQSPTLLTIHVALMILAYASLAVAFGAAIMHIFQGSEGRRHIWLPTAERCDQITYRSVLVGFPLLAIGVSLGALWANDAWGRYWGWDPKETAALVTWLIFAVYLHTRGVRKLSGATGSWIVVVGFLAVLFTYLAVNLWISGLHSYAGV